MRNSTTALTKSGGAAGAAGTSGSAGATGSSSATATGSSAGAASASGSDSTDGKDSSGRPLVPVNKNLGNVKAEHGAHPSFPQLTKSLMMNEITEEGSSLKTPAVTE
ncbi:PE-PGRS family protein PE_PGRS45-like [Macrobrachium nipponense]|uniref:PE-PGRS family protein PE_PGRS45-like n=1 Tax=Macrobrachium nipponense TaxID=159736 RepID=UPI0030C7D2F5